jgi:hypothetical protein
MIDMSLLYSRFLSHQPLAEQCAVVPEPVVVDNMSGSSAEVSPPALSDPTQHGFGMLSRPASSVDPGSATMLQCCDDAARGHALSEYNNFSLDQSCYDSLGLPTDGGDLVLPSTWDHKAKYEPFDSLPEDAMGLHGGGDDAWSKVLGYQGLEAALCSP